MGFRVQGSGFRVSGFGFRVWGFLKSCGHLTVVRILKGSYYSGIDIGGSPVFVNRQVMLRLWRLGCVNPVLFVPQAGLGFT